MKAPYPNREQILALYAWIYRRSGWKPRPNWKCALRAAWERAGEGVPGYSPELQQLRNQFGPEWLDGVSSHEIMEEAMATPEQQANRARAREGEPVSAPKHCDFEFCQATSGMRKVPGASGLYCADHAPLVAEQVEDDEREASCDYLDRSMRDTLDPDGLVHK